MLKEQNLIRNRDIRKLIHQYFRGMISHIFYMILEQVHPFFQKIDEERRIQDIISNIIELMLFPNSSTETDFVKTKINI